MSDTQLGVLGNGPEADLEHCAFAHESTLSMHTEQDPGRRHCLDAVAELRVLSGYFLQELQLCFGETAAHHRGCCARGGGIENRAIGLQEHG